jgi:hypothetical protein
MLKCSFCNESSEFGLYFIDCRKIVAFWQQQELSIR